jgi:nicotinamidase-related amidase
MMQVEIEDQSSTLEALKNWLQIDPKRTAVVTVDMHRGHLDPSEATMPVPMDESARVLRHAKDLLSFVRNQRIPVIHVILVWRPVEIDQLNPRVTAARMTLSKAAPKTDAQKRGLPHNLEGSVQTQLMPEVGPEKGDYIVNNKKTLSIFMGTDLEHLLKVLGIDTVVLIGINTNTCVQCGAFEAANRALKTIVISDCVASMYGKDLHVLGLQNIARCLGWVLTVAEFKKKVLAYGKEASDSPSR